MADVHEPEVRSFNMSQIKGKDTKPEMLVRRFLHASGYRYRLHDSKLPGKPDIILPKYGTIIFVHGCFWHAHEGCKYFVVPKTRTEWWLNKLNGNKKRDIENKKKLSAMGWKVLTIFECELKPDKRGKTLTELVRELKSENSSN